MTTRLWCSTLFLVAVVGCAGEEAPPKTELPQTPVSEIKPTPAPKTDVPKEAAPKEMPPKEEPKAEAPKVEGPKTEAPKADAPKAEVKPAKLTAEEIAEIKNLPAAEQDIALKQVVCPVSDEHLGEMGVPIKVTAEGKTFFLCCKSCQAEVKANPKAVIAKLAK